jgi:hypothetical protein
MGGVVFVVGGGRSIKIVLEGYKGLCTFMQRKGWSYMDWGGNNHGTTESTVIERRSSRSIVVEIIFSSITTALPTNIPLQRLSSPPHTPFS